MINSAREKIATAELELLSSTSYATSELWTDEGVIRQPGHAKILELIAYKAKSTARASSQDVIEIEPPSKVRIGGLDEAYNARVFKLANEDHSKTFAHVFGKLGFKSKEQSQFLAQPDTEGVKTPWLAQILAGQPPNLTLNVHKAIPTSYELWTFAILGVALQVVAAVIPALMTYYWKIAKSTKPVQNYAYPTFLVGTSLLVGSIALCSYVIEATTDEHTFTPTDDHDVKSIFRLQLQQNIGDQPYEAYVILNHPEDRGIRTSRHDPYKMHQDDDFGLPPRTTPQKLVTIAAVTLCFSGFICQFIGLRALHWSATVIQLGVTLLMTCIRSWIRRGISRQPIYFRLKSDPNWIALSVGSACKGSWPAKGEPWPEQDWHGQDRMPVNFAPWNKPDSMNRTLSVDLMTIDDPRIRLRQKLQSAQPEFDGDLVAVAESLNNAIRGVYGIVMPISTQSITWVHIVENNGLKDIIRQYARLELTTHGYEYDDGSMHALLAMWRYSASYFDVRMCVAMVISEKDCLNRIEFLEAQIGSTVSCQLLSVDGRARHVPRRQEYPVRGRFAGLSIENMQQPNVAPGAEQSRLHGYLVVDLGDIKAGYAYELLAGFMDALWKHVALRYKLGRWYERTSVDYNEIEVDKITNHLVKAGLVETEKDAKILVYSSLMRCIEWKCAPGSDIPVPTDDRYPGPLPPAGATTQVNSQQQDQPMPSDSATAPADESPQTSAATTDDSESQSPLTPSIPVATATETVQAKNSSNASAATAEPSMAQHYLKPKTPVSSALDIVKADTDKGERAATSSASEHYSTSTARIPVARSVRAPEMGESSRTGAQMAEDLGE